MKLTKTDIRQKRAELVDVLLKIEKLKDDKTSLEKTLSADFEQNEAAYRNGIATENGILIRRPSWKTVAKPVVEAAGGCPPPSRDGRSPQQGRAFPPAGTGVPPSRDGRSPQ